MKAQFNIFFILAIILLFSACGNSNTSNTDTSNTPATTISTPYNPETGIGRFIHFTIDSSKSLDMKMVEKGKTIFSQKCAACHQLGTVKILGPGWQGLTKKHSPAWLMNYLTNTDEMIDTDPEIKKLIASGSPRMPDQNLSDEEARAVLEFMRLNDTKK